MRAALALVLLVAAFEAPALSHVLTVGTPGASAAGIVVSTPPGIDCSPQCQVALPAGTEVVLTAKAPAGKAFAGFSAAPYLEDSCARGTCRIVMTAQKDASALFTDLQPSPVPFVWFTTRPFNETSVNTTEVERVYLVNAGTGSLTVEAVATGSSRFAATSACGTLATGAGCDVTVAFTPDGDGPFTSTLTISTSQGAKNVALSGIGARTLVPHFYQSILRRQPDLVGKGYWAGEAGRLTAPIAEDRPEGRADVVEVWYAMATAFYFSPEYRAFGRDDAGFVTDLYDTFFNRAPEAGAGAYWTGQLASGMPREVALAAFMFSPEFSAFNAAVYGGQSVRAEVYAVMDFYRGLLGRLPDTQGLDYWVARFRAAQCAGAQAVNAEVEAITGAFTLSGEYAARARNAGQFVGDLYNAFLRRGGELAGVLYWIDQVETGARSREQVRVAFRDSPEFAARVRQILAAGCRP